MENFPPGALTIGGVRIWHSILPQLSNNIILNLELLKIIKKDRPSFFKTFRYQLEITQNLTYSY